MFFNPAKLQVEVFDGGRNAVTLDNVSAFVSKLEIYPFYKWETHGRVQLTQMKDLKRVLTDAPVFRDMTGAAWVDSGSVMNGYNVYAARQIDSVRTWQLKYRDHFTSDTAYIERGERYIGNCAIYFHAQ